MTFSKEFKGLLAGLATVAVIGTAVAQGTQPNPNTANPATGAGQQSSQGTPMGTTGTPGATGGATMGSGSTMGASPGSTGSTMGTPGSGSSTTMGSDNTATDGSSRRTTRADRN